MDMHRAHSLLERLKEYQDRALEIAARSEATLALDDPSSAPELAQIRWEMMRALMPYAAFKHGELFPAMFGRGRPDQIAAATRSREECLKLGEDLKAYVGRWSSVSVADHWGSYRPQALAMLARLRLHMARERRTAESILAGPVDRRVPHGAASVG